MNTVLSSDSIPMGNNKCRRRWGILLTACLGAVALPDARAVEPAPLIGLNLMSNHLELAVSNMDTGGTYYIERTGNLSTNDWMEIDSFEGVPGSTNWMDSIPGSATSAFYRVVLDPYHEKVGDIATFSTLAHQVAGTAHIINNRTIELRNFYYDGGGIEVKVYLSPNPVSFNPYVAISDDLLGMAFTNTTLTLDVPVGTDLNLYTNISIWCTHGFNFGSGSFQ